MSAELHMRLIMLAIGASWIFLSFVYWIVEWETKSVWMGLLFASSTIVAAVLLPDGFGIFGAIGACLVGLLLYLHSFWKLDLLEREYYYRKISTDSEAADSEKIRQLEEEGKLQD